MEYFLASLIFLGFLACLGLYIVNRRKEVEKKLELQKANLEALFKNSTDAIAFHDGDYKLIDINAKFSELFGYSLEEIKGRNLLELINLRERDGSGGKRPSWGFQGEAFDREAICRAKEGSSLAVSIKEVPVIMEEGPAGGYSIYTDISKRKRYEEKLMHLTLFDSLTEVYNREFFKEEIARLCGGNDYPVSIIMVDLDDLKFVNDSMGHEAGNRLLKECAALLNQSVRKNDVVARIGGDEFALILPRTGEEVAKNIMDRILENLEKHQRNNPQMPLRLSLGLATSTSPEYSLMEAFNEADDSMYKNKDSRRSSSREEIISSLVRALSKKDFVERGHTDKLKELSRTLGVRTGLSQEQLKNLSLLCSLHDIGKAGISENIIFKEGKLTDREWREIKRHPEIGYRIAKASPDFKHVAELILYHHERWDGTGYPRQLSGENIPLECRIFSIVDAFDVMTSHRPYGELKKEEEALRELICWAGYQFDPLLVELFVEIFEEGMEETREEVPLEGKVEKPFLPDQKDYFM